VQIKSSTTEIEHVTTGTGLQTHSFTQSIKRQFLFFYFIVPAAIPVFFACVNNQMHLYFVPLPLACHDDVHRGNEGVNR